MSFAQFIWDDPEDTESNVQHIADHGLTIDEVEAVLSSPMTEGQSQSSGRPCCFGYTPAGEYIIVVYEPVGDDGVYPVTAYPVPEP
jgi:uncharacterized DUF497 family protein